MINLGAQLYTVRTFLTTVEDVKSTFSKVREIGYEYVQLSGLKNFKDEEIINCVKAEAERLGLKIIVTHIPYALLTEDFDYVVQMHHKLNCPYVGLGAINPEVRNNPSAEQYIEYAKTIDGFAHKLKEHDLKLVYHNHEFEFARCGEKTYYDLLVENTTEIQFEVDVFWAHKGGRSPEKLLLSLKDRLDIIHLKDYVVYHDGSNLRSEIRYGWIGEGNLDFKEIIASAEKANCKYMFVEQDDCYGQDPFSCLEKSFNYVKGLK